MEQTGDLIAAFPLQNHEVTLPLLYESENGAYLHTKKMQHFYLYLIFSS